MYNLEHFKKQLLQWNIELSKIQEQQLITYYEMLVEWNSFMNLTAITEFEEVFEKHFLDSISLATVYDISERHSVIDIGTGAGFPGLVLKIMFPNIEITLMDSLNKRIKFLDAVIENLGLQQVNTIHGRCEDLARKEEFREKFDICVSRAVANLSTLSEYALPFVKVGGQFISYKSEKLAEELASAENAIALLGGIVKTQKSFYLPETDIFRNLLVIDKMSKTDKRFPRKAGVPAKEPLK